MRTSIGVALALATWATIAKADDVMPLWQTVGLWEVRIDTRLKNSCFIISSWTDGTYLRIGFDKRNGSGYIIVGNSDWRSLVPGADYEMEAKFGNMPVWRFPAQAVSSGNSNLVWLGARFSDSNVLAQFASQPYVSFAYQGRTVISLNLPGSAAAVNAMVNCQDIMNAAADPFRTQPTPSTPSRDPFRPAIGR